MVEARPHMVSILNLLDLYLCPPSPPSHSSARSHCCDAEKDQYEALPPPSAKGMKKIWAVASWYFLGTPELHCPGGDGRASYREGPGSGFPAILGDLQGREGQPLNLT